MLALLMLITGCGEVRPAEEMDAGEILEGEYQNSYFQLTMPVPDTWNVIEGTEADDREFMAPVEATLPKTGITTLLKLSENEGEGIVRYPILFLYGRDWDTVKDSFSDEKEYLEEACSRIEESNVDCIFDEITQKDLGGRSFYVLSAEIYTYDDDLIYTTIFAGKIEDCLLVIGVGYLDFSQQEDVFAVLENLKFG